MKFVIIQCVKAYHHELEQILKSIKINAYSEMDVEGFMEQADGNTDFANWVWLTKKSIQLHGFIYVPGRG